MDWLEEAIKREATPKTMREGTLEDFCKKFDLPISNYYYHTRKLENQKKILEITLSVAKEAAPEILEVLVEMAKNKDIRAIDIYINSILQLAKILDLQTLGLPLILPATLIKKNDEPTEPTNTSSLTGNGGDGQTPL